MKKGGEMTSKRYINVPEAAKIAGIAIPTMWEWVRAGHVKSRVWIRKIRQVRVLTSSVRVACYIKCRYCGKRIKTAHPRTRRYCSARCRNNYLYQQAHGK